MANQLVCVSDVNIGFGSPQIPKIIQFLSKFYGTEGIIVEPMDLKKSKIDVSYENLSLQTVIVKDPYSPTGRKEYLENALKIVEKLNPKILVICTTYCLPILFQLKKRPEFVIYYYLETAWGYGEKDIEMNKKMGKLVDLIIFTEENRAVRFGEVCGFQKIPFCIVFNCVNGPQTNSIIPPDQRNGKIIYQGTIRSDTLSIYFVNEKIQSIPIDIYGNIDPKEKEFYEDSFKKLQEDVHYHGYITSAELEKIRKHYVYSIVMWNPINENNRFASPNKFFESIAAGVPPITAPHPQCKMLINRYKCGLVMSDWTFDSFYEKIRLGLEFYKTEEYEKMVKNCLKATRKELNWQIQMNKLKSLLKQI